MKEFHFYAKIHAGSLGVVGLEDEAFAEGVDDHDAMHQQRGAYVGIALYGDAMYLAEFETAPFQSVKVQQRYCVFALNAEVSDDVTAVFRTLNLLRKCRVDIA